MEAILQRYHTPSPASGLASSSSSFDHSSSTNKNSASGKKTQGMASVCVSCVVSVYVSQYVYISQYVYVPTSDSFPDSDSVSSQTSRNEEVSPNRDSPKYHGLPVFPEANSDEGLYHHNVLLAAERWFSFFGWPSGPHPISVPHTLRRYTQDFSIIYLIEHIWITV